MEHHCAHHPCHCPPAPDSLYCCAECEKHSRKDTAAAAFGMEVCTCGHPACIAAERHPQAKATHRPTGDRT